MVLQCLEYNFNSSDTTCKDSYEKCAKIVNCPELGYECFGYWQTFSNLTAISAGCIKVTNDKCAKECIGEPKGQKNHYCCCSENLCNAQVRLPLPPPEPAKPDIAVNVISESTSNVIWIVVPILMLVCLFVVYTYIYKIRRNKNVPNRRSWRDGERNENMNSLELNELRNHRDLAITMPFQDQGDQIYRNYNQTTTNLTDHHDANDFRLQQLHHQNSNNDKNRIDLSSIKLKETLDSGRFGTVHRATLNNIDVAVKIISANDYQTWLNEKLIYCSPRIKHPNVSTLLYSDEHLATESYWLIMDYAHKGSLHSFLKENIITWDEFLLIASGIVHGLSHLHEADIAHRDFKSKNILLKHDLVPCITDFGVAAILDTTNGSQLDQRKKYLQVGTPRYMAPEVLECSVTFTKASFTKIDVYALSLVLWELLSRCGPLPLPPSTTTSPVLLYKLPFDEYDLASQPDINAMRQIVVVEKLRPSIKEEWRIYPLSEVCRAIEDGWEYDYDARISASCFVERVESLPSCEQ